MTRNAGSHAEFFVKLIATHTHQVIALGVKEKAAQQGAGTILRGRLARLLTLVNFKQALRLRFCIIGVLNGGHQALIIAQKVDDFLIRAIAQRTQKHGDGQLTGAVNAHPQRVVGIRLVFQPCTAIRDDLRGIQMAAGFINLAIVISARRTNKLADDDALRTVDDECAMLGHERKIAHEHVRLLDFARFAVFEAHENLERCRIRQVTFPAAFDCIFGRAVQRVIDKLQNQIFAVVGYGGHIGQNFF